jgi:hypothetical protein
MNLSTHIANAHKNLENPHHDPDLIAYTFIDHKEELEAMGLYDLCWALAHDLNCHRNDIKGFLELLEKQLKEQECQKQS